MTIDWPEALEIVIARTGHERYRALTADDHPDHEIHRRRVIEKAGGDPGPAPVAKTYPPVATQVFNIFDAAVRMVGAWWKGESIKVGTDEVTRRIAICLQCEKYDPKQGRCTICGCFAKWKNRLATEHCPLPESEGGPKW